MKSLWKPALTAGLSLLLLTGPDPASAQVVDRAYSTARPSAAPVRAGSNFDLTLRCMDDLLARDNYAAGVRLLPSKFEDPGGAIGGQNSGATSRDMIIASAARMSEKSRFFTVMSGAAESDFNNNLSTVIVSGSITEFDKSVESKGSTGAIGIGASGVSRRKQRVNSVLTITLYLLDTQGVVLPGTLQTVSMALTQKDSGGDLTGGIGTLGGFLELNFSQADGNFQAVRALMDLAMIQAVGAYAQVPYYRCLTQSDTDPLAIQTARKVFDKMKPPERIQAIGQSLVDRSLLASPAPSVVTPALREAIAAYQAQSGMPPLGLPTFEVYYALEGRRYGVAAAAPATAINRTVAVHVSPYGPGFSSQSLAGGYVGQVVFSGYRAGFAVTVADDAHVACFYFDANQRPTRIFPTPQRPTDRLKAGDTLLLPGPQDIFQVVPDTPDRMETVSCFAAKDAFLDHLPSDLRSELRAGARWLPVKSSDELSRRLREAGLNLSEHSFSYLVCDEQRLVQCRVRN